MKQSLILTLVSVANAVDSGTFKYMQYISKMNKSPTTIEEFNTRMSLFLTTDAFIEEWNANLTNAHTVGHNFISDWTADEKKVLTKLGGTSREEPTNVPRHYAEANQVVPAYWNWTQNGTVGAVQNQAACGDCYAFSAIGAVQSSIAIAKNYTAPGSENYTGNYFSVQQATSCSQAYGNNGCGGGTYYWVWEWMQSNPVVQAMYYPFADASGNLTACNTPTNASAPFA